MHEELRKMLFLCLASLLVGSLLRNFFVTEDTIIEEMRHAHQHTTETQTTNLFFYIFLVAASVQLLFKFYSWLQNRQMDEERRIQLTLWLVGLVLVVHLGMDICATEDTTIEEMKNAHHHNTETQTTNPILSWLPTNVYEKGLYFCIFLTTLAIRLLFEYYQYPERNQEEQNREIIDYLERFHQ